MVNNNRTTCGLAQVEATYQSKLTGNRQLLKEWYRFFSLREVYLTSEEMETLRAIALTAAGRA
jgi:hypothetical protein